MKNGNFSASNTVHAKMHPFREEPSSIAHKREYPRRGGGGGGGEISRKWKSKMEARSTISSARDVGKREASRGIQNSVPGVFPRKRN